MLVLEDQSGQTAPSKAREDGSRDDSLARRNRALLQVVEGEILPRLLLAHQPRHVSGPLFQAVEASDPVQLAGYALEADGERVWSYVETLQNQGVPALALLEDVIAPAARHLGKLWEDDTADFFQVTAAVRRLVAVMQTVTPEFSAESECGGSAAGVLLTTAPGETHTFGVGMAQRFFKASGWRAECCGSDAAERRLASGAYAVIGVSISCERYVPGLAAFIARLRQAAGQSDLKVLIGGRLAGARPGLAEEIGADACVADASTAVRLVRSLLQDPLRM